jgi:TrmH RNA methyltransferase
MPKRQPQSSTTKRPNGRGGSNRPLQRDFKRDDHSKFYGVQCCLTLFDVRKAEISRIFVAEDIEEQFRHVLAWADRRNLHHRVVSAEEVSRVAGTEHHEGVCFEAKPLKGMLPGELTRKVSDLQRGLLLVLEGVENPHNVGAILRTACFFGVQGVVIRSRTISALSGAACRIAEGAAEHVPFCIVPEYSNFFSAVKARGFSVIATTPHEARSLYGVKWPDKAVVLFGAEGTGLSQDALEMADLRVAIPRMGPMESLNVAASVASVLTEARRDAVLKGHVRRASPASRS